MDSSEPSTSKSSLPTGIYGILENEAKGQVEWPFKTFSLDYGSMDPDEPSPDYFDAKIHPQWKYSFGTRQFVSPCEKSLAYWDYKYGVPYFYRRGFLRRNTNIQDQFEFCWNPEYDPYPKEKPPGM